MNLNEAKNKFQKISFLEKNNTLNQNESKNLNEKIDKTNKIKEINKKIDNNENKENQDINILNNIENKKYEINSNIKNGRIKYGIDENGNPIDINEYYKNISNKKYNKKPRLVAYIIKDEDNNNILINLNGNKITKNKKGDYEFPFQFKLLINDFDVKHPELRINGEREFLYEEEEKKNENKKEKIVNNNNLKNIIINNNNINHSKEQIIEEISFQIDSIETSDNTSQKISNNNAINSSYRINTFDKKEYMDIWKLRYGKNYNNKDINSKKEKKKKIITHIKSNERRIKNYSYSKVNIPKSGILNNREIITRTNSILNLNNINNNIYYKINNFNSVNKINFNKNNNSYCKSNNSNFIISQNEFNFSPIRKKNNINSCFYRNDNINSFESNKTLIRESFLSNNITENNNINNLSNNQNNFLNDSSLNQFTTLNTFATSPSLIIYKNKVNKNFYGFKSNTTNPNIVSNQNNKMETNNNRVENILNNNNKLIQLHNKLNVENKSTHDFNINNKVSKIIINKCFSRDNINNKKIYDIYKLNNIIKKVIKTGNIKASSYIKNNDFLEKNINNKENNNENKNINNNKLISKIPNKSKIIKRNNKQWSILSKDANNMINNFLSKSKKNFLKKCKEKQNITSISNILNNIRNKSFNKDIKNKSLV